MAGHCDLDLQVNPNCFVRVDKSVFLFLKRSPPLDDPNKHSNDSNDE